MLGYMRVLNDTDTAGTVQMNSVNVIYLGGISNIQL